jgi:hypothetical protein
MTHPYEGLPPDRFWKTAVADRSPFRIAGLWTPKFRVGPRTRIITAGSCFAQHISRALTARNYRWIDAEPAPAHLSAEGARAFHYGTFSFRTGNIYTANMLRQWLAWAYGEAVPPDTLWETAGRFYDPFRPGVEPGGFISPDEAFASRAVTLAAIRRAVEGAGLFVFTLGLTEAWQDKGRQDGGGQDGGGQDGGTQEDGVEYALCPGTMAGAFDAKRHVFVNHRSAAIRAQMDDALRMLRAAQPKLQVLLTVSPVPLTATAAGGHVLTATTHSKSVLRAVAGEMAADLPGVDYFPSYEIITAPAFRGMFYGPNQRSVDAAGVNFVMNSFFNDQVARFGSKAPTAPDDPAVEPPAADSAADSAADPAAQAAETLRCEEEILGAFAK